jgi:hypothetical protein
MDLISRQAAIDALIRAKEPISNGDGTSTITPLTDAVIRKVLNELPSVQEQRWIPVDQRLPPSGKDVIVSCHDTSGDTSFDYTSVGWTTPNGEYWIVGGDINRYVCAWMPMPRAYKRGR